MIKQPQGLKGLVPVLIEVLSWIKCYQAALPAAEKLFLKGRVSGVANFIVVFQEIATMTPAFISHHPNQSAAIDIDPPPAKSL